MLHTLVVCKNTDVLANWQCLQIIKNFHHTLHLNKKPLFKLTVTAGCKQHFHHTLYLSKEALPKIFQNNTIIAFMKRDEWVLYLCYIQ